MGEPGIANENIERRRSRHHANATYEGAYPVKTSEDQAIRLIFSAKAENLTDKNIIYPCENVALFHKIEDPRKVQNTIEDAAIICETEGVKDGKIKRFENLKDFFAARKEFLYQNSDETKKFWHDLLCTTILYYTIHAAPSREFCEEKYVVRHVTHEIFSSFTEVLKGFSPEERKNALEAFVAGSNPALKEIKKFDSAKKWLQQALEFPDADKIFPEEIEYNYAKNHEEAFVFRVKEKKTSLDKDSQPSTNFAANHYPQSNTRPDNDPEKKGMSLGR